MNRWNGKNVIRLKGISRYQLEKEPSSSEAIIEGSSWTLAASATLGEPKSLVVFVKRESGVEQWNQIYGSLPDVRIRNIEGQYRYYKMKPVFGGPCGTSFLCDSGCTTFISWDDFKKCASAIHIEVLISLHDKFTLERYRGLVGVSKIPPMGDLSLDFSRLLETRFLSDFTINLDNGESMHLHKVVLAARSPVFEKMFNAGMKESTENILDIKHADQLMVKKFIKYLYTSKLEFDEICQLPAETFVELFKLADLYEVGHLKTICELELIQRITPETAADILILADTHEAPDFRECVIRKVATSKSCLAAVENTLTERPKLCKNILSTIRGSLPMDE